MKSPESILKLETSEKQELLPTVPWLENAAILLLSAARAQSSQEILIRQMFTF